MLVNHCYITMSLHVVIRQRLRVLLLPKSSHACSQSMHSISHLIDCIGMLSRHAEPSAERCSCCISCRPVCRLPLLCWVSSFNSLRAASRLDAKLHRGMRAACSRDGGTSCSDEYSVLTYASGNRNSAWTWQRTQTIDTGSMRRHKKLMGSRKLKAHHALADVAKHIYML